MDKIIAYKRPDDGEIFSINYDGTFSLESSKKRFPDHLHHSYTGFMLENLDFIPIYETMKNKLYIIIGPSGSGKSTKAKTLAPDCCICEADKFWLNCTGEYLFVPSLLGKAHQWCQSEVERLMNEGKSRIVVSNTSLTDKERKPYSDLAEKHGYEVVYEYSDSPWFINVRPRLKDKTYTVEDIILFTSKSTHNVPFEGIKRMFDKYTEPTQ